MMLVGSVQVSPAGVEPDTDVFTVPASPFTAVSVTVEVAEAPPTICAGETAPAVIVKSTTWNSMDEVVRVSEPLKPVTVMV